MLRAGGSAADAAVAVQLVLNLVEPQSSGIGGGAFILHWDAGRKDLKTYDGRETAPAGRQTRPIPRGRPAPRAGGCHLRRPEHRGARHPACAGGPAQAAGQAAVGAPVRARHQAGRRRLPGARAPASAAALARRRFLPAARPAILLRRNRQRPPDRLSAQEPGVRRDAARDRRARCRCLLHRARWPRRSCRRHVPHPIMPATSRWPILPAIVSRSASRCARSTARTASAAWGRRRPAASPSRRP